MIINKEKAILLIDMDAFFASCHISIDNSLKGKALVVSSPNSRAIISTASYEARKYGLRSGMPIFKAKKICPNLAIVQPDFHLYVEKSNQIFSYIKQNFSKAIEVTSIDECYLDVTKIWKKFGSVAKVADAIRSDVQKNFNLTCSIGVSTNKFLAKMASGMNKPNGTFILLPSQIKEKLWPLPVEEMYGVGIATKRALEKLEIKTIGDLAKASQEEMQMIFGKRGYVLAQWANGLGSDELEEEVDESKSISNEMTLSDSTTNVTQIEDYIYELTRVVCHRLQKKYLQAKVASIQFKYEYNYNYDGFDKIRHSSRTSHQYAMAKPSNELENIFVVVKDLFHEIWDGRPIFFLGVGVSQLTSSINNVEQVAFTADFEIPSRRDYLNELISKTNGKNGNKTIMTGQEFANVFDKINKKGIANKVSKIDDDRINEKEIKISWSEKGE